MLLSMLLSSCIGSAQGATRTDMSSDQAAPVATEKVQPASHAAAPISVASAQTVQRSVEVKLALIESAQNIPMAHVWQSMNNCGPAAAVMALSTLGLTVSQESARLVLRGEDENRGMGPGGVAPWVEKEFGLRAVWRTGGTNEMMKRLIANGFTPMVTQWLEDPSRSRVAHWRTVRGYDQAHELFYVNDSMRGNNLALSYGEFAQSWQVFGYRYLVIYRPEDEPKIQALLGGDWDARSSRNAMHLRAREEADAHNSWESWLALGEASYQVGRMAEAAAAFERGMALDNGRGVYMMRSSYPNALVALGRTDEAHKAAARLQALR